jgi:DNA-binding transcriptional regulator YiaG
VYQFRPSDIDRICRQLNCSRAQLAATMKVSRACVTRWAKGVRGPQGGDAARLRALVAEETGPVVNVFALRARLRMTQRVFGAQFGVSRQQVQKWETGKATPHRSQLDKLVRLADAAAAALGLALADPDLFTIAGAAKYSGITAKTLRKAVKQGRLLHTIDTSPGPWPRSGRFLIRRTDLDAFRLNDYDPYFKKGRWLRLNELQEPRSALVQLE